MWKWSAATWSVTLSLNTRICSHIFKRIHSSFRHKVKVCHQKSSVCSVFIEMNRLKFRPIFLSFLSHQEKKQGLLEGRVPAYESSDTHLAPGYKTKPNRVFRKLSHILQGLNPSWTFSKYPCLLSYVKVVCTWCPDSQWGAALPGQYT